MASSRLQAFRQTITVHWPQATEQQARALLVRTAREGIAEIVGRQSADGVPPGVTVYANRPGNPNIETVKLPGPIVALFDYRRKIAAEALLALIKASPVVSGAYRDSHTLFLNGAPVAGRLPELGPQDELMITNTVPYARRIEIGKTKSGRPFVRQVPPRIYETVAGQMTRRGGILVNVRFAYVSLPGGFVARGRLSSHYGVRDARGGLRLRKRPQQSGAIRYPALFIEPARTA